MVGLGIHIVSIQETMEPVRVDCNKINMRWEGAYGQETRVEVAPQPMCGALR